MNTSWDFTHPPTPSLSIKIERKGAQYIDATCRIYNSPLFTHVERGQGVRSLLLFY
jgi:hypothetical protein